MAEESEGQETGAQAASSGDPIALGLAMGRSSAAVDGELTAYLRDQRHHLNEQRDLLLSRLRLGRFSDRAKAALQVLTGAFGLVIAVALVAAVWNASHADGTVVDAFSVPPGFAQNGITGEIVADDLTGKIGAIRDIAENNSFSRSKDVRKDSAEDIKVEIPETGISLGQASRYLRLWLGHERHLSGNVRLVADGKVALTVAIDGRRAVSVSGTSGELDRLEQQAAEQVFASVDPTNIVLYLLAEGRDTEGLAAAERGTQVADGAAERASAYSLWGGMTRVVTGDMELALSRAHVAADINPKLMTAQLEMMAAFALMGHDEEALQRAQAMQALREEDQPKILQGRGFTQLVVQGKFRRDTALGAFAQAASEDTCGNCSPAEQSVNRAEYAARAHDGAASRMLAPETVAAEPVAGMEGPVVSGPEIPRARYFSQVNVEDWSAAAASARAYEDGIKADPAMSPGVKAVRLRIQVAPLLAYALARTGDVADAIATIDATPDDCYDCIRTRGLIATTTKQWGRADYWFARAEQAGPSLPFAYADWGQALLERGDADGAIARFKIANQKGPRFADPLEGWGEALMAQNRSDWALAKFSEAEKYAPHWGRLHLKWGEALWFAGRKDEARKEYGLASTLDLSAADQSELARQKNNV